MASPVRRNRRSSQRVLEDLTCFSVKTLVGVPISEPQEGPNKSDAVNPALRNRK